MASNPSTEIIEVKQHPRMPVMKKALQQMLPQYAAALPSHIKPERYLRVILTALQNNWELMNCDPASLLKATLTCAQLGLEPDPNLGQAWFIPFKDKVQFIPGYKGYITLARNSGEISSIAAHEVRKADLFEYEFGLDEKLIHKPARGERGEVIYFYAYARFKDGSHYFDVLSKEEVDKIRDNAPSATSKTSPWKTHYEEMGKKTAIRRIAKYLPQSVQKAAAFEDALDAGRTLNLDQQGQWIEDSMDNATEERAPKTKSSRLDKLAEKTETEQQTLSVDPDAIAKLDEGLK